MTAQERVIRLERARSGFFEPVALLQFEQAQQRLRDARQGDRVTTQIEAVANAAEVQPGIMIAEAIAEAYRIEEVKNDSVCTVRSGGSGWRERLNSLRDLH